MAYDKIKYNNEYNKENYADIKLRLPKDMKKDVEDHFQSKGYTSMNSYIKALIEADMNK